MSDTLKVKILSGQTESEVIFLRFKQNLSKLIVPANLDGTSLTFKVSDEEGGTYVNVNDTDNTNYSITVSSSAAAYIIQPSDFAGFRFLKIVSNATELADREFTLIILQAEN